MDNPILRWQALLSIKGEHGSMISLDRDQKKVPEVCILRRAHTYTDQDRVMHNSKICKDHPKYLLHLHVLLSQ
jgi:hypothetical protein